MALSLFKCFNSSTKTCVVQRALKYITQQSLETQTCRWALRYHWVIGSLFLMNLLSKMYLIDFPVCSSAPSTSSHSTAGGALCCRGCSWSRQPALKQRLLGTPSPGKRLVFHSSHKIKAWCFCAGCVLLHFHSAHILFILLLAFLLISISSDFSQMLLWLTLNLFLQVLEIFLPLLHLQIIIRPSLMSQ